MDAENIVEIEVLARRMAELLERGEAPQTAEQAQAYARALEMVQLSVVAPLLEGMTEFTLANGPVYTDGAGDKAYGHWEKRTTTVSEENELWEFLSAKGFKVENYKRADLTLLKTLSASEEKPEGLERFVGTDISMMFGYKKNLLKKPKTAAGEDARVVGTARVGRRTSSGPTGRSEKAKVVVITPGPLPERDVVAGCGVMPPKRVMAKV